MKAIKYLIATLMFFFFFSDCLLAGEDSLIKEKENSRGAISVNPTLAGLEKLYVIIEPASDATVVDGLVFKELEDKVKSQIEKAGIAIEPGVELGKGDKDRNIAELRIYMEMLKLDDIDMYVFRIQTSLAEKVYIEDKQLYFKAAVWSSSPLLMAEKTKNMPDAVTSLVGIQVDDFIKSRMLADKYSEKKNEPAKDNAAASKETVSPAEKVDEVKAEYVGSKNSKVFHNAECPHGKGISAENLVSYANRDEAIKADKRPCKRCNP